MIEQMSDRKKFSAIKTLCDCCRRATGDRCLYLHLWDVEEGLQAAGADAVAHEMVSGRVFKVIRCRDFEAGGLHPWQR